MGVSLALLGPVELDAPEATPKSQGGKGDKNRIRDEAAENSAGLSAEKKLPLIRLGEAASH